MITEPKIYIDNEEELLELANEWQEKYDNATAE